MTLTRVNSNSITDGSIVDADVSASAAIAGTKVSPDFGSQSRTSTGTSTAAAFIPTSSSVPTNGVYLPGANALGLATASTERVRVTSGGLVGIGTTAFPASTPIQVKAVGAGAGGYAIVSANDENAGGIILNSSSDNSIRIEADPGSLRASSYINLSVDGTERARIDSSGRLLVGTSTAGHPNAEHLTIAASTEAGITIRSGSANAGSIYFSDATSGTGQYDGYIEYNQSSQALRFGTASTEHIRVDNVGRTGIYSSGNTLDITTGQAAGTTWTLFQGLYSASNPTNGVQSVRIYSNGNVQNTNNSYTGISDVKLKENIIDANSQWADLKAFRVRNFNFKEGQTHKQIGLIAQEVEPISPGLVYESPDRDADGNDLGTVTKSVNYSVLYMKAVKALQEAMERIETLEAKVAALEAA